MADPAGSLARALDQGTLTPTRFDHRAHLQVAYEMLAEDDFLAAAQRYASGIRRLAAAAGAPDKFNLTITLAFLSLISERLARQPPGGFDAFIATNPDLLQPDLLASRYSAQRLNSPEARSILLLPDQPAPP